MTLELAIRVSEIILAMAFIQQSLEHLRAMPVIQVTRIACCVGVLAGLWVFLLPILAIKVIMLRHYNGPYNGGADRMGALALICIVAARLAPNEFWAELALGYLAVQLTLSYFISGRVKIVNPDWRSGQALSDVFAFSAYPVAGALRPLAQRRRLMWASSWFVMLLELSFPLLFLSQGLLIAGLTLTFAFHLANACLFGLNRFLWVWLSAYPSILWLQDRVF